MDFPKQAVRKVKLPHGFRLTQNFTHRKWLFTGMDFLLVQQSSRLG